MVISLETDAAQEQIADAETIAMVGADAEIIAMMGADAEIIAMMGADAEIITMILDADATDRNRTADVTEM